MLVEVNVMKLVSSRGRYRLRIPKCSNRMATGADELHFLLRQQAHLECIVPHPYLF